MTKINGNSLVVLLKIVSFDAWCRRALAYSKAIRAIQAVDYEILTSEQVRGIFKKKRGIGNRIAEKVEEIISTGKITKLEEFKQNPERIKRNEFIKIHGIGPKNVDKFMSFKGVEELRGAAEKDPSILSHRYE